MLRLALILFFVQLHCRDAMSGQWLREPVESRLIADAADGRFDQFTLLEAALIAASPRVDTVWYRHQFDMHCQAAQSQFSTESTTAEKIRAVFAYMHREVLTGQYRIDCSNLADTIDHGDYNCVTATVLFQCFCERFELSVVPVATAEHVTSRMATQPVVEIETTCPNWFGASGPLDSRPANQAPAAREISSTELVARVFYNRGLMLAERRQYSAATGAFHASLQIDPQHHPSRKNLSAAFNNWAIALSNAGQYADAIEALKKAGVYGDDPASLRHNLVYVYDQWADAAARDRDEASRP